MKKLKLNKKVIANISDNDMNNVKGGEVTFFDTCNPTKCVETAHDSCLCTRWSDCLCDSQNYPTCNNNPGETWLYCI